MREDKIQKFIDHYFLPHYAKQFQNQNQNASCQHNTDKFVQCNICAEITKLSLNQNTKQKISGVSQDDIDVIELMDPKMTPERYMQNILKLYRKEEYIKNKQGKDAPTNLEIQSSKITRSTQRLLKIVAQSKKDDDIVDPAQMNNQQIKQKQQIQRLKNQCYIGLGKTILERKQIHKKTQLTKANYHTRQYLLPIVKQQIERLEEQDSKNNVTKYYLMFNANSRGINLEVDKIPLKLSKVLQFNKFRQIVCTINQIIQRSVYNHKLERINQSKMNTINFWTCIILFLVIWVMIYNSRNTKSAAVQILSIFVALCLIIFFLMFSCHRFRQQLNYLSLIDLLNDKISDYLKYINSRPSSILEWKTTKHLYWLQITPNQKN